MAQSRCESGCGEERERDEHGRVVGELVLARCDHERHGSGGAEGKQAEPGSGSRRPPNGRPGESRRLSRDS
jgi:hypothetical protein